MLHFQRQQVFGCDANSFFSIKQTPIGISNISLSLEIFIV